MVVKAKEGYNPLEAVKRYYEHVRGAPARYRRRKEQGQLVGWTGVGADLSMALGVSTVRHVPYALLCSEAGIVPMLCEVAEAEGFSPLICGYMNLFFGTALLMLRGEEERIPEWLRIPPPDFVAWERSCHVRAEGAEIMAEMFNVPFFLYDTPFDYDRTHHNQDTTYVAECYRDVITFVEGRTGHRFDQEKLKEIQQRHRQVDRRIHHIQEYCQNIPTPIDAWALMQIRSSFGGRGDSVLYEQAGDIYAQLDAELAERVREAIGIVEPEKHRLVLVGQRLEWGAMPRFTEALARRGAVLVGGSFSLPTMGWCFREQIPPDGWDLDRPLFTLARQADVDKTAANHEEKLKYCALDHGEGRHIDGVILTVQRTCQLHSSLAPQTAKDIEKMWDVPTVIIEVDHIDPRQYSIDEVIAKVNSFIDVLETREKKR